MAVLCRHSAHGGFIVMETDTNLNTTDLSFDERLDRFKAHKSQSDAILPLFRAVISSQKKQDRICECGTILRFTTYQNIQSEEVMRKLSGANFCDFKICPMCQWRKAREVCNDVLAKVQSVSNLHNGVAFLFLTLTIKNPPISDLRQTLAQMSEAFRRFQQTKAFRRAVLGFVRAVEYVGDQTKEGEAHPHFHCLLVVRKSYFKKADYLTKDQWASMWQKALRVDYVPMINIQKIKPKGTLSALQSACLEVIKYSVSFADMSRMSQEDLSVLIEQTKGLRQYALGGEVKDAEPAEIQEFDPDEWEKIGTEFYQWKNGEYVPE